QLRAFSLLALYFWDSTQAASFLASASFTCAFAGIGTGPHTPEPPFMILTARRSAASFWPAYLAATSLYAGPTSFLSMAWQAMQFLAVARAWSARAGAETAANTASANRARFIRGPRSLSYIPSTV